MHHTENIQQLANHGRVVGAIAVPSAPVVRRRTNRALQQRITPAYLLKEAIHTMQRGLVVQPTDFLGCG